MLFRSIIRCYVSRETNKPQLQWLIDEDKEKNLIEVPIYDSIDGSFTFLGRLLAGIITITSPSKPIYYFASRNAWFDQGGGYVFGPKTILNLSKAFGIVGVNGLDQIISHQISKLINNFGKNYKQLMDSGCKNHIEFIRKQIRQYYEIEPTEPLRTNIDKTIESLGNANRILISIIEEIGRLQLVRKIIRQQLMELATVDSKGFYQVIENLNYCSLPQIGRASCRERVSSPV